MQNEEASDQSVSVNTSFEVDVNEAVQLLGVSRTRLSQLVSKGVLGFERRRVDTRLRMYFNRTELLSYLRRQMSGASAKVKQSEWIFDAAPAKAPVVSYSSLANDEAEILKLRSFTSFRKHGASPNAVRGANPLKASALSLRQNQIAEKQQIAALAGFQQEIKNQSRHLEKRFQQLHASDVNVKPIFVSAKKLADEQKKTNAAIKPRVVRTLSRRAVRRVLVSN